ncbi:hypothetical protein F5884DRAFT_422379 [Xylogone sp. PMI_703]|nr:hypothetical protein F5884DRAFT_422379 [Xylogone sp. PMI_703]
MRGLWKAVLCLAAVVAPATSEPGSTHNTALSSEVVVVRPTFSDHHTTSARDLVFRVDISGSHDVCGYTDIRINGQPLSTPYVPPTGHTPGHGYIPLDDKRIVTASWSLQCINSGDKPDHVLLEFDLEAVDGMPIDRSHFKLAFNQTNHARFLYKTVYDAQASTPSSLGPDDSEFNLDKTLAELQWLKDQVKELQTAIRIKQHALSQHGVTDCDNFKCVTQIAFSKASDAAHTVINKITGHQDGHQDQANSYSTPPAPPAPPAPPRYECTPGYHERWEHTSPRLFKYLLIMNILIVGVPFIVISALILRCCTCRPTGFKEWRRARREARRERSPRRPAAFRAALSKLCSRFSRRSEKKDEEKEAARLSDAEDGMSTTMTDEITQFQNVVSIVDDMVHAEQTRTLSRTPLSMPPEPTPPVSIPGRRQYYPIDEIRSEADDEELPAYASYDENHAIYPPHIDEPSEDVVSNGFQYSSSPGSSIYTPSCSSSETSSIVEIADPETKQ